MTEARNERNQIFEKNKNFVFHIYKFNLEKTHYKKWNEKQYLPRRLFILFLFTHHSVHSQTNNRQVLGKL